MAEVLQRVTAKQKVAELEAYREYVRSRGDYIVLADELLKKLDEILDR